MSACHYGLNYAQLAKLKKAREIPKAIFKMAADQTIGLTENRDFFKDYNEAKTAALVFLTQEIRTRSCALDQLKRALSVLRKSRRNG